MFAIEWNESFSVGVKELDEQHKRLFKIFDDLLGSLDTAADSRAVVDVLEGLKEYASVHFATEEKYMSECGYPQLENHKRTHEQFRKKVDDLCSNATMQPVTVLSDTLKFLYAWLSDHILSCDRKYASLVSSSQQ